MEKRRRFDKIASSRVQYILDKIHSLSKCSNRNNYSYNEKDVNKMFNTIRESLKRAEIKFEEGVKKDSKSKFQF